MPVETIDRSAAELKAEAARVRADVDNFFARLLAPTGDGRERLFEAMRHAAIGGGKRLRPMLTIAASRLFAIDPQRALRVGCAIEAIHVYSLIHDDLPCMDDADLRRGKLTVHKAFGEAEAVLAGDSLHALAFDILAHPATHEDPWVRCELVLELARAAGPGGMAGGQMMDLVAEGQSLDIPAITRLQQLKTGALIEYAVEAACIMTKLPNEARTPYRGYARNIGLAFQIADDLIDFSGDEAAAGKRTGKDAHAGKATFVSLLGEERARQQAGFLVNQAIEHLSGHGVEADLLRAIARFAVARDHSGGGMGVKVAVYPGTFDPITLGHLDIIRRGAHLVDKLVIGVTTNPSKEPMFSVAERMKMVRREVADVRGNVETVEFDSLLMDFAEAQGATMILRGLRAVADFEYEFQMAGMNQQLNDNIETVFLMADVSLQPIASKLVKEIARYGGSIEKFVTPAVAEDVRRHLNGGSR